MKSFVFLLIMVVLTGCSSPDTRSNSRLSSIKKQEFFKSAYDKANNKDNKGAIED